MKAGTVFVAAAGIGHAAATFGGFKGFRGATPFTCPGNTDNTCEEKQREGFDWSDLVSGEIDFEYHGFKFAGFTCKDRDGGAGREVEGECGPDKGTGPSFEYGEGFSIDEIEISTEFDTDLEFVYEMPDGKECKQRSSCKEGGSVVKNTQCGGAKKVVVVHPPQSEKQEKCKVKIPKISFNCEPAKPPKSSSPGKTSEVPESTGSLPESTGTAEVPEGSATGIPGMTEVPGESTATVSSSSPGESTSEAGVPGTTENETPGSTTAPGGPGYTEGETPGSTSAPGEPGYTEGETPGSTSTPGEPGYTEGETPGSTSAPDAPESTVEPSYPEGSTPVPSEPIVETLEPGLSTTENSSPESPTAEVPESEIPETSEAQETTGDSTAASTAVPTSENPTVSAPEPQETLPCPEVVPSCLNTWLFELDCPDNTDTACFCPSAAFVENVFTCIYAHGESDAVISEALRFVQGICAEHAPENPGIVTGINSITSVITVPEGPKPTVPAEYTTVIVSITTEVPCVTDGTTLTASLTTSTIKQTVEVPNVGFQTNPAGEVGVVPSTPAPVVVSSTVPSTLIPQPSATGDADPTGPGVGPTAPPQAGASGRVASLVGVGAALFGIFVLL